MRRSGETITNREERRLEKMERSGILEQRENRKL